MNFSKTKVVTALLGTMLFLGAACKKNSGDPSGIIIELDKAKKAKEAAKAMVIPDVPKDTTNFSLPYKMRGGNIIRSPYDSILYYQTYIMSNSGSLPIVQSPSVRVFYNGKTVLYENTQQNSNTDTLSFNGGNKFFSDKIVPIEKFQEYNYTRMSFNSTADDMLIVTRVPEDSRKAYETTKTYIFTPAQKNGKPAAKIIFESHGDKVGWEKLSAQECVNEGNKIINTLNKTTLSHGF